MLQTHYDYIITGAGCAGLSLAVHIIDSGKFADKKILLVDEVKKNKNDRTWCFWEKEDSLFESIVHRQWNHLWFYGDEFYKELAIVPYRYKMIRGLDFYNYCLTKIKQHPNFEIHFGKVENIFSEKETGIVTDGQTVRSEYVFNSILFEKPALTKKQHWLLQHFKGWTIRTEEKTFDYEVATLMDFRISQKYGTAFCYVLPLTSQEALIEYTLFTQSLLQDDAYDAELKHYIEHILHLRHYKITDKEFGIIPMTDYKFPIRLNNIINIGTAGGRTKGSSGYTFYFIQKHSEAIVNSLLKTGRPFTGKPSTKFHFYDSVMLNILQNNILPEKQIFNTFFKKNHPQQVLKFLNNETTLLEDVQIISSLPTLPFLKAAIKQNF